MAARESRPNECRRGIRELAVLGLAVGSLGAAAGRADHRRDKGDLRTCRRLERLCRTTEPLNRLFALDFRLLPKPKAQSQKPELYHPSTFAKINGATIVASDSITNFGVSAPSFPQVIFSFGTAPEYDP